MHVIDLRVGPTNEVTAAVESGPNILLPVPVLVLETTSPR